MVGFRWPYYASATQNFAVWVQRLLAWFPPVPHPRGYTTGPPTLTDAIVYDAIFVFARALKHLLETEVINPTNGHTTFSDLFKPEALTPDDLSLSVMTRAVRNVSFIGPSGLVKFDQTGARAPLYEFCHGAQENNYWWCRPWGLWTQQTSWMIMPGVNFTNGSSTPTKDCFKPDPVGFISVQNVDPSSVSLSWARPNLNYGRDVTYNLRLRVKWAPDNQNTGIYTSDYTVVYNGTSREFVLHDLPLGAVLEAQVETVTHAGSSSFAALTEVYIPAEPIMRDISGSLVSGSAALAAIGSACTISFMIWMHLKRNHAVVRASSLLFCQLVLLGTLVAYQAVTMMALEADGKANLNVSCAAMPFVLQTAFALIFVSMFIKTYRLYRIFFQKVLTVQHRLTDRRLLVPTVGYVTYGLIVNAIWSSNSEWRRGPFTTYSQEPIFPGSMYTQSVGRLICHDMADPSLVFWFLLLLPNVTLIGLFMVLSFKVRTLTENFNESRYIAMALWNFIFILLTMTGVGNSNLDADTSFLFHAAAIWAMCLSTTLILFLPKVFAVMTWNSRVAPLDAAATGEAPTYGSRDTRDHSKMSSDTWTGGIPHSTAGRTRANTVVSSLSNAPAGANRTLSVSVAGTTDDQLSAKVAVPSPSLATRTLITVHRSRAESTHVPESAGQSNHGASITTSSQPASLVTQLDATSPAAANQHIAAISTDDQRMETMEAGSSTQHGVAQPRLPAPHRHTLTPLPPLQPRSTLEPTQQVAYRIRAASKQEPSSPATNDSSSASLCAPLLGSSEPASPVSPPTAPQLEDQPVQEMQGLGSSPVQQAFEITQTAV